MNLALVKAILVLPGTVLVYVPIGIFWAAAGTPHEASKPQLEQRFGEDYRRCKANVPRWVPRATPWDLS